MNRHQRMERKRARRIKRTTGQPVRDLSGSPKRVWEREKERPTGTTRGKVRGPVTRGKARAALMNEGESRLIRMSVAFGPLGRKYKRERARR